MQRHVLAVRSTAPLDLAYPQRVAANSDQLLQFRSCRSGRDICPSQHLVAVSVLVVRRVLSST